MFVSLEISKYPLTESYVPQVWAFIERLRSFNDLEVHVNAMSTHVYGELKQVFAAVQHAIEGSFSGEEKAAIVLKVLPGDVRDL